MFKWLLLSAEQGHAAAQYFPSMLYFEGKWVLKDYKEGVKWIRLAAEQGHAQPKNAWGSFIEMGKG